MRQKIIYEWDISVSKDKKDIPAKLIKYSGKKVGIKFNSIDLTIQFNKNCSDTLRELDRRIRDKGYTLLSDDDYRNGNNHAFGSFLAVKDKKATIFEFDVFVVHKKKKIPARFIKYTSEKKLRIEFQDNHFEVEFKDNWFKSIRLLDNVLNKEGYKLLCNGISKYVYARGFCVTMGDGSTSYRLTKPKYEIVNNFEYSPWNEYATEEEQEISFFGKGVSKND